MNFHVRLAKALKALMVEQDLKSMLEIGSGLGLYTSFVAKHVPDIQDIVGVEPQNIILKREYELRVPVQGKELPRQCEVDVLTANNKTLASYGLDRSFDVVFSSEVLEHIPRTLHPKFLDFMVARASKFVILGVAPPGQGTHVVGHIAPREKAELRAELEKRGLRFLPTLTAAFENAEASKKAKNLMVMAKDVGLVDEPDADLMSLGRHNNRYFYTDDRAAENHEWPKLAMYVQTMKMNKMKSSRFLTCRESDLIDKNR